MTDAFGASDSEGAWDWKSAYDACEVAEILFLRRYGQAIVGRATPSALALIARTTALMPTHPRRTESSLALQPFSTQPGLAFVAGTAAAIHPGDHVLDPPSGNGLITVLRSAATTSALQHLMPL